MTGRWKYWEYESEIGMLETHLIMYEGCFDEKVTNKDIKIRNFKYM